MNKETFIQCLTAEVFVDALALYNSNLVDYRYVEENCDNDRYWVTSQHDLYISDMNLFIPNRSKFTIVIHYHDHDTKAIFKNVTVDYSP